MNQFARPTRAVHSQIWRAAGTDAPAECRRAIPGASSALIRADRGRVRGAKTAGKVPRPIQLPTFDLAAIQDASSRQRRGLALEELDATAISSERRPPHGGRPDAGAGRRTAARD